MVPGRPGLLLGWAGRKYSPIPPTPLLSLSLCFFKEQASQPEYRIFKQVASEEEEEEDGYVKGSNTLFMLCFLLIYTYFTDFRKTWIEFSDSCMETFSQCYILDNCCDVLVC